MRGRPFAVGPDPRRRPGSGRPKEEYLAGLRRLEPAAFEVVAHHLKKRNLVAALAVLNRLYGKPKETVTLEGEAQHALVIPDAIWKRFQRDGQTHVALPAPPTTEKA